MVQQQQQYSGQFFRSNDDRREYDIGVLAVDIDDFAVLAEGGAERKHVQQLHLAEWGELDTTRIESHDQYGYECGGRAGGRERQQFDTGHRYLRQCLRHCYR